MATAKMDYKKEYKDLYLPKRKPSVIDVPAIGFIMVDGKGAPEGLSLIHIYVIASGWIDRLDFKPGVPAAGFP